MTVPESHALDAVTAFLRSGEGALLARSGGRLDVEDLRARLQVAYLAGHDAGWTHGHSAGTSSANADLRRLVDALNGELAKMRERRDRLLNASKHSLRQINFNLCQGAQAGLLPPAELTEWKRLLEAAIANETDSPETDGGQ